jgi:hypothetical protein
MTGSAEGVYAFVENIFRLEIFCRFVFYERFESGSYVVKIS